MKTSLKAISLSALALIFVSLTAFADPRPSARCMNIHYSGSGALGFIEIAPGIFSLGFPPQPAMLGDLPVLASSYITSLTPSGSNGQGAQHITLRHTYTSTDPARPGSFVTEDRAVCAPAGKDPNVCRVNDVLTIVSGTGIFANAGGKLTNHGVIDLNTFTLSFDVRGRVCGDGL